MSVSKKVLFFARLITDRFKIDIFLLWQFIVDVVSQVLTFARFNDIFIENHYWHFSKYADYDVPPNECHFDKIKCQKAKNSSKQSDSLHIAIDLLNETNSVSRYMFGMPSSRLVEFHLDDIVISGQILMKY